MVGDICDEDELATGYRAEGSYYSIFWWLIKMGTAFASFIAGALIVLTAFDEIQVTKVDGLQGNIRGIRSEIQSWGGAQTFTGTPSELLGKAKTEVAKALNEAKKYVGSLELESAKQPKASEPSATEYQSRKRDRLRDALATMRSTAGGLEQLQVRLANLGPQAQDSLVKATVAEAIPLTLQTRLEKARMNSFELMAHLQSQSRKHKDGLAHYEEITRNMTTVDDRIASLKAVSSLEALEQALTAITNDIVPLTKQTPFTLLMMRVVEIGLPVLLSLVSLYFLFQYSLTEKRSHEIKDLLKQRNEARSKEAHDAPGAMTV
jgi:hypothetical protein